MSQEIAIPLIEPIYRRLGRRVRERRIELGRTQEWLADRFGLSRASVANIEAGRQRVLLHQLFMLARILKMPPESLAP